MSFRCGFFNSVNGDRKYTAEEMNNPYSRIVSDGVFADPNNSVAYQVQSDGGLNLIVKKGYGIFAGKWGILDADMSLTIPTPHVTQPRIDSIIVRVDTSEEIRKGEIVYVQGTASSTPVHVQMARNSSVNEYRLADIYVEANATSITQANITDTRPSADCGFITNLLQDSDISATYAQWQTQFEEWLNQEQTQFNEFETEVKADYEQEKNDYLNWTKTNRNEFDAWYMNIKDTLSKTNLMTSYFSSYTTTEENENNIPIGITALNSVLDCVQVHINGMLLIPDVDYTMNGFETITLTKPVDAGTVISFSVLKTIDGSDAETVVKQVQDIFNLIDELQNTNEFLKKKIVGIETGTSVSYELEPIPDSLVGSSSILVEAQDKMYGMSFSQLKGETGKIAVVPISTSEKKEIGEMWIENEIINVNNLTFNFSEIGKMSAAKKNQCACISDMLYVLNENGKLFKIDLENNSCVAMYEDLTFEFIQVTDTLIVFVGLNTNNTVAIQYRTGTEYRFANNNADNFLSSVDKVFNFGNILNKFSCFTVNDTENKILQIFQFIIDAENNLSLYYNSETAKNYSDNMTYYCVIPMFINTNGEFYYLEEESLFVVTNEDDSLPPINIQGGQLILFGDMQTKILNYYVYCFFELQDNKYYLRIIPHDIEFDSTTQDLEHEFYFDDEVTSEVISLINGFCKFYTLQKATNGFAVIRYDISETGVKATKLQVSDSVADLELVIDLDQQDKADAGQIVNPEIITCGNDTNLVAEKTDFEYESKLKIKLPNGIKNIGVTE